MWLKKQITCIVCPVSCEISITYTESAWNGIKVMTVDGNICERGREFVIKEMENPERTIASSVLVEGGDLPLVSVRTDKPISKAKIFEVMNIINQCKIKAPVKRNQIIVKNILDLNINIIATKTVNAVKT
jgi:CxxC motif-containing protein